MPYDRVRRWAGGQVRIPATIPDPPPDEDEEEDDGEREEGGVADQLGEKIHLSCNVHAIGLLSQTSPGVAFIRHGILAS